MIQECHSDPREDSHAVFITIDNERVVYLLKKKLVDNYWIAEGCDHPEVCILDVSEASYFYHYE